ncbi:hypothetical protein LSTR_LSTR001328 [Laodelphax striatellus]|uniref:ZAD domain-containing protein n=1 Tax=Laodelphax striatellus TaxID=195883 RepID=A0A482XG77_LAOST|nr:hypothetical protein LSTR_LSTR001328 [Laodelphax striatellus]
MGSVDSALMTGFICRLCSKMNKLVIHIYGEEGVRLQLSNKINTYLPINMDVDDPLPKTMCRKCIQKIELQHKFSQQFQKAHSKFARSTTVPLSYRPCQMQTVGQARLCRSDLVPFRMEKEEAIQRTLFGNGLKTTHRSTQITGRGTGHTGWYHRRHNIRVRLAVCDRLGLWDLGFRPSAYALTGQLICTSC